jgi:hypothetical protein
VAIKVEHEIHHRRFGRNLGVGVLLGGFVVMVFALTLVKVSNIEPKLATKAGTVAEGAAEP